MLFAAVYESASDAVDGSSSATEVPWTRVLLRRPRSEKEGGPQGRPCISHEVPRRSDSRAPRSLDEAIALAVLFHVPERRERCVERLHEHLVGDQHVEHFSPRRFRHVRNLIEEGVPTGI